MNTELNELIEKVKQWGIDKGITGPNGKATLLKQLEKTQEELTETRDAAVEHEMCFTLGKARYSASCKRKILDGYGDQLVTIILGLEIIGSSLPDALNQAYNEIKGRTGTMKDGMFIKDS